jgi:hypothetical protein
MPEICQLDATTRLGVENNPPYLPLVVWGLDIVGRFKTAPSGYIHLLVTVDIFTKWVEEKHIRK